jgi:hypothetical protein
VPIETAGFDPVALEKFFGVTGVSGHQHIELLPRNREEREAVEKDGRGT